MKNSIVLYVIILLIGFNPTFTNTIEAQSSPTMAAIAKSFPKIAPQPVTEDFFGTKVRDDFRNLENLEDPEVIKWFKEQGAYASNVLDNIPGKKRLIEKMREFDKRKSYAVTNVSIADDDQYFFLKQAPGEKVASVYYRKSFEGEDELLYDPANFKPENGFTYVINYISPSWDGSLVAVAMSHSGTEISEMILINPQTKEVLPQIIGHCWPADGGVVNWLPDNSGFTYLHYPEIDHTSDMFLKELKSVIYKIGDDPKDLNIILSRASHPELDILTEDFPIVEIYSKNDKYIYATNGGATTFFDGYITEIKDVLKGKPVWKPLYKQKDKVGYARFNGDTFVFAGAKESANYQLRSTSTLNPSIDNSTILVDAKEDEVIGQFQFTSNGIYYTTTKNGVEAKLYQFKDGVSKEIKLPVAAGQVNLISKGADSPELHVSLMGWLNELSYYHYNTDTDEFKEQNLVPLASFPEFENFVVKELVVPSHDGVEVPMSIIHKKDILMDGQNPVMAYGYGSYGALVRPFFESSWMTWVDAGGILVMLHVRGGGEKGDSWHQAGKKVNKPNSWKDLIACTEYLIKEGYTSPEKMSIFSGSAGGILVGRAMTERPDLFAAVIPIVSSLNPMRMEHTPNGLNNTKEFGISKDSIECAALIEMDPYLQIKKNTKYPASLVTTGWNDARVVAWQPAKFAAKLQTHSSSEKPVIFAVDFEAGHGFNETREKWFEQISSVYTFAFWQSNHPGFALNPAFKLQKKPEFSAGKR